MEISALDCASFLALALSDNLFVRLTMGRVPPRSRVHKPSPSRLCRVAGFPSGFLCLLSLPSPRPDVSGPAAFPICQSGLFASGPACPAPLRPLTVTPLYFMPGLLSNPVVKRISGLKPLFLSYLLNALFFIEFLRFSFLAFIYPGFPAPGFWPGLPGFGEVSGPVS
jgi:hypothetical protein